jgi:alpha-ketoglutaric semialdehyde dehydrogenase
VGMVMPWNNPLALPAGKAAAALALGNAVVLKPAPQAPTVTAALEATATAAGVPADLICVVHGGPAAAMAVVCTDGVDAVAVTGSIATGQRIAAQCTRLAKPLQAELGGNNAVVVLDDADIDAEVPMLVAGTFAFAGQRCTALRRAVVHRSVLDRFIAAAIAAMDTLAVGDPFDPATQVGPLISPAAAKRVAATVADAIADGAQLVHQTTPVPADGHGWYAPTLLMTDDPTLAIVVNETFGPVLVIQPANDVTHAIALANGVQQGLLGAVCTTDDDARRSVADALAVGIVQIGAAPPAIDAEAPFGGWGASGIGPPEHGRWDVEFLTRLQAVYEQ